MAKRNKRKFEEERQEKAQPIVAQTQSQKEYLKALQNKTLVVPAGAAGTGKSFIMASHAANRLVKGEVENVVLARPYVTMGKSVGMFPGTINDKLEPFVKPMLEVFRKRLGDNDFECRVRTGRISIQPLEAIRGMSFENCILLVDEAQNTTPEEVRAIVTRIGENCQLVFCGDPAQSDIKGENGIDFLTRIIEDHGVDDAEVIHFKPEDIVRSGITKQFVQIFDKLGGDI